MLHLRPVFSTPIESFHQRITFGRFVCHGIHDWLGLSSAREGRQSPMLAATWSRPPRPNAMPLRERNVVDSDQLLPVPKIYSRFCHHS